ncbi:allophanate hydrolase subunit 2-domain-containing protein [Ilyonectria sp. MPI-CAGE-AT-0026]|nr:allophanate hydrolase subunit 2-domain-containing protein [Ilyonectria sp. MPI-CAGE-AT-0026]
MGTDSLVNIRKVLVANRGEIAVRCLRACKELGITSVAIFTNADATSQHVSSADEAVLLPGSDSTAYIDANAILEIGKSRGVDAVIPGYGFLSENADFAAAAAAAGIIFVGPTINSIKAMGLKHEARQIAQAADVPVIPGTSLLASAPEAVESAKQLGFPVMMKATGGGGGMGLQICHNEQEVSKAYELVESRAGALFSNSGLFLEKYYPRSRHVEVQVVGNGETVVAFGERECSLQRRHQKVIEECPSPIVERTPGLRQRLLAAAVSYASQLNYKSVGTVEFLVDDETTDYFFLEMNTRLQVEHGITELCYQVDLVHLMLRQADYEKGGHLGIPTTTLFQLVREQPHGAAIETRVYAEDPLRDFAPSPGVLQSVEWPAGEGIRVDTWVKSSGQNITPHYDPLIGKVMVHSPDGRESARKKMIATLRATTLQGTQTNLAYLSQVLKSKSFIEGNTLTNFLSSFEYKACAIQVLSPGLQSTIQDYPGRPAVGHGIPKSGPMDDLSSRVANVLVGNEPGTELIETTMSGLELLFHTSSVIAVCGSAVNIVVDGKKQCLWSRFAVKKGQTLKLSNVQGDGCRTYVAIKGGFPQIPNFLGSKSTAPELGFGGLQGRKLQLHDVLDLAPESDSWAASATPFSLPDEVIPDLNFDQVYCLEGPYGSEDIITPEDKHTIYSSPWTVGNNSGRSGIRLSGPTLNWSRSTGGSGGSHPSNVFDYGYPRGGINWTGDSPVILSCDSPDMGGFVCLSTICSAELWKIGQLKPGTDVRLRPTTIDQALALERHKEEYIEAVSRCCQGHDHAVPWSQLKLEPGASRSTLRTLPATANRPKVTCRQGGDRSVIVEYGDQVADLRNTVCVEALHKKLTSRGLKSITSTPHVATLTVHYDPFQIHQRDLVRILLEMDSQFEDMTNVQLPVREVHLPVCLDHPELQQATQRYMNNIRSQAAYLPDNIEYIRKNNALNSRRDVYDALLNTSWLAVAVGFFVGTPMLFPMNPKYSYVAQKYNPSRVYTPSGSIGLGGSLLGLYPVASPGGYQLIGRTLGTWDPAGTRPGFSSSQPWLFNYFDLIKFYEVSETEYADLEREHAAGTFTFKTTNITLDISSCIARFQAAERDPDHCDWKKRQLEASIEMAKLELKCIEEWNASKDEAGSATNGATYQHPPDAVLLDSPVNASVWKVEVAIGDVLRAGQTIAVLEAMKMEINVVCAEHQAGAIVKSIMSPPGTIVSPGSVIVVGALA